MTTEKIQRTTLTMKEASYRQVNSQFVLLYEDIVSLEFKSIF